MAEAILVIDHAAIQALTAPGRPVFRYTQRLAREVETHARLVCPVGGARWGPGRRAGNLRSRHFREVQKIGPNQCEAIVGNDADYASFVHDGTGPVIYPNTGDRMNFRINGQWRSARSVRGQNANPWLAESLDFVMKAHRI